MSKIIRIGTRDSQLALWQAKHVQQQLESYGYSTELVPLKSTGDIVLNKPLYELGITGIFTKTLDIAMLNEDIDIAVHSLKDVPTVLPKGIVQVAVLERGNNKDLMVFKGSDQFLEEDHAVIATGSLRRKAQWLHKYPTHSVVNLRGNVNTRLEKLNANNWNAAIFAAAGLERINMIPEHAREIDWMVPAPSQGAIMITALEDDTYTLEACAKLNHKPTEICTHIERRFLNTLEGGCTAPIGGLATIKDNTIHFHGILLSEDGSKKVEVTKTASLDNYKNLGESAATEILASGGKEIMSGLQRSTNYKTVYSSKVLNDTQKFLVNKRINIEASNAIEVTLEAIDKTLLQSPLDHVVITSKNGVEAILKNCPSHLLKFNNIYCVGRRTRRLIEDAIGPVVHAEKNSKDLANYLKDKLVNETVTYFCSDIRLDDLPKTLEASQITLNEVIAYRTTFNTPKLNIPLDGAMFYSPSTVKSFVARNRPDCTAFCIGESTANEARLYFKDVRVAKVPTVESVIELVNDNYV